MLYCRLQIFFLFACIYFTMYIRFSLVSFLIVNYCAPMDSLFLSIESALLQERWYDLKHKVAINLYAIFGKIIFINICTIKSIFFLQQRQYQDFPFFHCFYRIKVMYVDFSTRHRHSTISI